MVNQRKSATAFRMAGAVALFGGLTGVVHAQSNVTLYGVLDSGVLFTSRTFNPQTTGNGPHQWSMIDGGLSGSRWGMTGSEDLGGGTKAIFTLESGISTVNGRLGNSNGNLFGRMAYVGIDSNLGTVKAGVQYSPFVLSIINTEPRSATYFGSGAVIYLGSVLTTGLFTPNAISYTSPVVAGLQGSAMLALGGEAGDFQAGRQYSARLKYTWENAVVDAALFSGNAGGSAASTPVPTTIAFTGRTIGASYGWGPATLRASFTSYKIAGSFDEKVYAAGIQYLITPGIGANAGAWVVHDGNDTANHSLMVSAGLEYYLSKRTTLYGQVAVVNNHGLMHTGLSANGALYGATGTTTGVTLGIHHAF